MSRREKLIKTARILSICSCVGVLLLAIQHLITGLTVYLNYAFGLIIVYLTLQTIILAGIVRAKD